MTHNGKITPTRFRGLDVLCLQLPQAGEALISLAGGQLVSWVTEDGVEQIYMSPCARLEPGHAIRGGVPVIFPQFSDHGALMKHGFARTSTWDLLRTHAGEASVSAVLGLTSARAKHPYWPHKYACEVAIELRRNSLAIQLNVENTGEHTFEFTAALHSYFRLESQHDASLFGLQHCRYQDAMSGGQLCTDTDDFVELSRALDRVYLRTPAQLTIHSPSRKLRLQAEGFTDTVVWNPGQVGSAAIDDLPPDGYKHFICVEAAAVEQPVQLLPGQRWFGLQRASLDFE
jgi:glucose-6-phosphate 1-epimerase